MKHLFTLTLFLGWSSINAMHVTVALTQSDTSGSGALASYYFGSIRVGAKRQKCFDIDTVAVTVKEIHDHLKAHLLYRADAESAYIKHISFNLEKGSEVTCAGQLPDSPDPIEFSVDARMPFEL